MRWQVLQNVINHQCYDSICLISPALEYHGVDYICYIKGVMFSRAKRAQLFNSKKDTTGRYMDAGSLHSYWRIDGTHNWGKNFVYKLSFINAGLLYTRRILVI